MSVVNRLHADPLSICPAKLANGEQCARIKKRINHLCGVHMKGTPHGLMTESIVSKKIQLTTEDIQGILYFIDIYKNIYHPYDILDRKENPKIIGKIIADSGHISARIQWL